MVGRQVGDQLLLCVHKLGIIGKGDHGCLVNIELAGFIGLGTDGDQCITCYIVCFIVSYADILKSCKPEIHDRLSVGIMGLLGTP